jgi:hypothetical protein
MPKIEALGIDCKSAVLTIIISALRHIAISVSTISFDPLV